MRCPHCRKTIPSWKTTFPLMHNPDNRRWLKMVSHGRYKLTRASVKDIMDAFGCDRKTAKWCYDTGNSPASEGLMSSARTREEADVRGEDAANEVP